MRLSSNRSAVVLTALLSSVTLFGAGCVFDSSNAIPHGGGGAPATTSSTIASSSSTTGSGGSTGAGGWGGATGSGGSSVTTSSSSGTTTGGLGDACTSASECGSGNCVDDVCCDAPCDGACETCSGTGKCGPAAAGTDPDDECATTDAATCQTTGFCDGAGACARYAAGVVCGARTCSSGKATPASMCDGLGLCKAGQTVDCLLGCAGDVCTGACTVTSCPTDKYCAASGSCEPKAKNGATCSDASTCQSGFCADGVCCNTACTGACQVCSADLGATKDGQCGNAGAGDNPRSLCVRDDSSACGLAGQCDGAGACAFRNSSTVCGTTCDAGKLSTNTCTGAGTCGTLASGTTSCNGYQCNAEGTACRASCGSDGDCTTGFTCKTTACVPKPTP